MALTLRLPSLPGTQLGVVVPMLVICTGVGALRVRLVLVLQLFASVTCIVYVPAGAV